MKWELPNIHSSCDEDCPGKRKAKGLAICKSEKRLQLPTVFGAWNNFLTIPHSKADHFAMGLGSSKKDRF